MTLIQTKREAIELIKSKQMLIFDFDGVILDSVHLKTEAFAELYEKFNNNIVSEVREFHEKNGGMSRFEKIHYYNTILLKDEYIEETEEEMANRFSELVFKKVIVANEIPGVMKFINYHQSREIPMYINSATPTNELNEILNKRGWTSNFKEALGSPSKKTENLLTIISSNTLPVSEYIFFGDALSDQLAASEVGMDFIGIGDFISKQRNSDSISQFNAPNFLNLL